MSIHLIGFAVTRLGIRSFPKINPTPGYLGSVGCFRIKIAFKYF